MIKRYKEYLRAAARGLAMRLDDVSHLMLLNLGPPFDDAELYSVFWDRVTEPVGNGEENDV